MVLSKADCKFYFCAVQYFYEEDAAHDDPRIQHMDRDEAALSKSKK
jgi:hypothetical protein